MEEAVGFEPTVPVRGRRFSRPEPSTARPHFLNGAGDGARTRDMQLGRLPLYQLSYSRKVVLAVRIELTACGLQNRCSTD
jgi:hypothetical protein